MGLFQFYFELALNKVNLFVYYKFSLYIWQMKIDFYILLLLKYIG
jgi:hypothetical protein